MGKIQEISDRLFLVFQEGLSLEHSKSRLGKKPSDRTLKTVADAALAKLYVAAENERKTNHLGILGRARVAFHLQQRMITAGYPLPLVRQVLVSLLMSAFIPRSR